MAQGLFTGTITASSALIASNTPDSKLSYALGFLSSSTFIGYSLGPMLGGFIAELVGYRVSFFIGAVLMMLDFLMVLFIAKEEKAPVPVDREDKKPSLPLVGIFTAIVTAMLLVLFFARISRTVFSPYLPLFVQELLSDIKGAARTTGIINGVTGLMTAVSGITLSRFGDRYNKMSLLILIAVSGIFLSLPLVFINNLWIFTLVFSIFSFAVGGIEPLIMSITCEHVSPDRRGTLFGIQTLVGSLAWAVSPLLGSMVSIRFSIQAIMLLMPGFFILVLLTAFVTGRKCGSQPGTVFKNL